MSSVAYQIPALPLHREQRPHLRLVALPRAVGKPSAAVYRRRQLVAGVMLLAVLLAVGPVVGAGVNWAWHKTARESSGISLPVESSLARSTHQSTQWTVRPGDSLWSIAKSVQPQGDFRPVLNQLIKTYGNQPLEIGQTIVISS